MYQMVAANLLEPTCATGNLFGSLENLTTGKYVGEYVGFRKIFWKIQVGFRKLFWFSQARLKAKLVLPEANLHGRVGLHLRSKGCI